ncbi:hypothetical protein BASA61_003655 [Batrachochytrium salamandrivorans]|nr:hypothetical protein BASA61_003655 [Batrachochytrium salamandrivorans]
MFGPALTLVLALASSAVIASPTVDNVYKRAVASLNPSSTELPFHFPDSVYENTPYSDAASSSFSKEDDAKTATDHIFKKLNLGADDFKVLNSFTDPSGVTHVYGAHMANGVRIANHQAAAHVRNGQVTSFSSSFGTAQHFSKSDLAVSAAKATVDFEKASATASAQLGIPVYSDFKHALEYVEQPDGKIAYAYKLQLRNNPVTKWVQVWCDADTGKVIQAVDFGNKASYKAIPVPRRDASEGFSMVANPEFKGIFTKWMDCWQGYRGLETSKRTTLARVEKDGDAVVITVLNTSDVNNADFLTPPDGQSGEMNMYRFAYTTPNRSSGLDSGIAIHEYGHGVSNRLTGGSATGGCLSTAEARGMGEGWSDMMALMILAKSSDTATTSIPMGMYVAGKPAGIRSHPYTTNMKVNPWTYGDLKALDEVHDVGEVWASLLWEVYWSLVTKHGFSANLHDAKQSAGNIVAMQNIIGGLMLQPCNPTFLSARNAILDADASYYRGANKCEIYKAFAKRGLGSKATSTRNNDFSVPPECDGDTPSPDPTTTDTPPPDPTTTDTEEATTTTKRPRTTTKKTKTTATKEATTTTKRSRTTTKKSKTTSRAPEPTDEPDDEPTDESDDDPTFEPDEFAKM